VAALVLERVEQRSRDRFQAALERKLAWFGSELVAVGEARSGDRYVHALRTVLDAQPDLIMAAGASSLDPLEPLFGALDAVGARIVKHGVPVHPGSLFWIAYVGSVPLFGLSSCEMFSHRTILDLVLPRLFAGEPIGKEDLARLGHGGMLGREMAFRFPQYGPAAGAEDSD
jgi:molybdopterin biosynthesis enzyme